jgi:uncharacterized protein
LTVEASLRSEIRGYYGDGPVHGWGHALRVERLALRILGSEDGVDEEVVRLGAVLHDIGRRRESAGDVDEHASWGAAEARDILGVGDRGYDDGTVDAVAHCVVAHRHSTGPEPRTAEARTVADADDLDALGAVGVARAFGHGGGFDDTADHIRDKLLSLRDGMRTEAGREIAEDRHRFTETFLREFEEERQGSRGV